MIDFNSPKWFWTGVVMIISASAIGWVMVPVAAAALASNHTSAAKICGIIWTASWVPFGLGFFIAGRKGAEYSRKFFRSIWNKMRGK